MTPTYIEGTQEELENIVRTHYSKVGGLYNGTIPTLKSVILSDNGIMGWDRTLTEREIKILINE